MRQRVLVNALSAGWLFLALACPAGATGPSDASPAARSEPLFSRHVSAVFSRLGCNGGTCHGAVQGQNGFRLSLFGADPAVDHERLLREFGGRRLNLSDPDASLLLLKATGRVAHGGGKRLDVAGPEYRGAAPLDRRGCAAR